MATEDCPNGTFPDYGDHAVGPGGLDLCVRVHSTVWFAVGTSLAFFWQGMVMFLQAKHPESLEGTSSSARYVGLSMIMLVYDLMFLGGYQRDFLVAGMVLVGACSLPVVVGIAAPVIRVLTGMYDRASHVRRVLEKTGLPLPPVRRRSVQRMQMWDTRVAESTATNVYADFSTPLAGVLLVAAAQITLCCFYVYALCRGIWCAGPRRSRRPPSRRPWLTPVSRART